MAGSLIDLIDLTNRSGGVTFARTIQSGSSSTYGQLVVADTNGWASRIVARIGKTDTGDPNPVVDALLYRQDGTIYTLVGRSATLTLTSTNADDHSLVIPSAVPVVAGVTYAVVLRAVSGRFDVREYVRSSDRQTVSGNAGTGTPTSPWTPAAAGSIARTLSMQVAGYRNVVPTAAVTSPALNASSNVVPAFTVSMSDSDRADFGDSLQIAWLHIVGDSGGAPNLSNVRYGPQATAIANADGAGTGTITPAISLPAATYWVRMAASDRFGATSAFTAWQKLISTASANIQAAGTLGGSKQEVITGIGVPWLYTNPAGFNAASIQVELYRGTTRIRQSAPIAVTWTPGSTNTITWAQLVAAGLAGGGAWADLQWGQTYGYQAIVTDTQGTVSPASDRKTFTTDAAPGIPATVAPKGNINLTNRPILRVSVTDVDDTVTTGLAVVARIKSSTGAVLFTRTMTYTPATNDWRYQTTETDIPTPSPGTRVDYRWDASAYDGTLYSGEATVNASRAWSTEETFGYTAGPTVTITSPADGSTITTANPDIVIAFSGTASRVSRTIYRAGSTVALLSLAVTGSLESPVTIPVASTVMFDGQSYDIVAQATVNGVVGSSAVTTVTLDYPAYPAPLNFQATPFTMEGAPFPTLTQLSWDPTTYSAGQFIRYVVTARPEGEPEGSQNERTIADITDPASTMCFDGFPASGVTYRYTLRQSVLFGNDIIPSEPSEQTTGIVIRGVCISVANDPTTGVVFVLDGSLPSWQPAGSEDVRTPFGSPTPVTWVRTLDYLTMSASFPLRTDPSHPLAAGVLRDRTIAIRRQVLCWRDRDGARVFFRFPTNSPVWQRIPGGQWDLSIEGRQESWREIPVGVEREVGFA